MPRRILAYIGGNEYGTGTPYTLVIPDYNNSVSTGWLYYYAADIVNASNGAITADVTIFTGTDTQKALLEAKGFTNVISLALYPSSAPLKIWTSPGWELRVNGTSNPDLLSFSLYKNGTSVSAPANMVGNRRTLVCWDNPTTSVFLEYSFNTRSVDNDDPTLYLFRYGTGTPTGTTLNNWVDWMSASIPEPIDVDPYEEGGASGSGGGGGTWTRPHDTVDIPLPPAISAVDAGFITLYNPTVSQLQALASYMWTNNLFDVNTWKKIFADPMDAIIGLSIVPVNVPAGSTHALTIGNISTDVSMTEASAQYVTVDCGSIALDEYFGAYLDYSPYTKIDIYLPYIGIRSLDADDVMGKTLTVKYNVDILSGACTAFVKCGDTVLYSFIGQCASSIPITSQSWTNTINGVLNIAGAIGTTIATGGATAPMAVSSIASTAVNSMKPQIEKSGGMSGTGGMLGIQTPYLIVTQPRQCIPSSQNNYIGYPAFFTVALDDMRGFTIVESIHLENIPATSAEINEIEKNNKKQAIFIIGYNPLEKLTALLIEYLYDAIIKFNKRDSCVCHPFDIIQR